MNGKHTLSDGTTRWYRSGMLHREDGPAVIYPNGDQDWYFDNFLHRNDGGPAVEKASGEKLWFIMGEQVRMNMERFMFHYKPNKENITLLLNDPSAEVRTFARDWYRENNQE